MNPIDLLLSAWLYVNASKYIKRLHWTVYVGRKRADFMLCLQTPWFRIRAIKSLVPVSRNLLLTGESFVLNRKHLQVVRFSKRSKVDWYRRALVTQARQKLQSNGNSNYN